MSAPAQPGDLVQFAIDVLRRLSPSVGLEYGEARFIDDLRERIRVRDDRVEGVQSAGQTGIGIRVLARGAWGFSSASILSEEAVERCAREAVEVARAAASVSVTKVRLAEEQPQQGSYRSTVRIDPFAVPLEKKIDDLRRATAPLRTGGAPVRYAEGRMDWVRVKKIFASTEGARIDQETIHGGGGIHCVAVGDDRETQRRSYPTYYDGGIAQGGYEAFEAFEFARHAPRVREEVVALLKAPLCPSGDRTVILESSQLALQIHESCGHPTELDRALGTEISLAGGSFLTPDKLDHFRYGSERVTLVADATVAGGVGTFGYDDEGVPARRVPLVDRGLFVGYLSSRETAAQIGRKSSGAMRADGYARIPLIRMVNVSLDADPGGPTLADLIAGTDDGVYFETNKSWSIDDLRLNFQFGCEAAWEIQGGKKTRLLRNPVYTGVTPRFWGSCDQVCAPSEWRLWGLQNCGKGEPMQIMHVGHGTAPARFRNVAVGGGGSG